MAVCVSRTERTSRRSTSDQPFGPSGRSVELKIGRADTRVVLFPFPDRQPGGFLNVVFQSDDVQKAYEELRARGVELTQEPKTEAWGTSAMFRDSEGNVVLISSK